LKLIVTGAGGLVGRSLVDLCLSEGDHVLGLNHATMDITDKGVVDSILNRERPNLVVNCAAWTDVDACEVDPRRAQNVNASGPEILALACSRIGALLITISTDYVFDGRQVLDQHFPHQGAGVHVPLWITPALARDLIARHGKSGHVIPHPNLT